MYILVDIYSSTACGRFIACICVHGSWSGYDGGKDNYPEVCMAPSEDLAYIYYGGRYPEISAPRLTHIIPYPQPILAFKVPNSPAAQVQYIQY